MRKFIFQDETTRGSNKAPLYNRERLSVSQRLKLLLTRSTRFGTVFGSFLVFPIAYFRRSRGLGLPDNRPVQSSISRQKLFDKPDLRKIDPRL